MYMKCLRENSSTSSPCRDLSRDYLDCRMQKYVAPIDLSQLLVHPVLRGLMEKDEWKNLGLDGVDKNSATSPAPGKSPKS